MTETNPEHSFTASYEKKGLSVEDLQGIESECQDFQKEIARRTDDHKLAIVLASIWAESRVEVELEHL